MKCRGIDYSKFAPPPLHCLGVARRPPQAGEGILPTGEFGWDTDEKWMRAREWDMGEGKESKSSCSSMILENYVTV